MTLLLLIDAVYEGKDFRLQWKRRVNADMDAQARSMSSSDTGEFNVSAKVGSPRKKRNDLMVERTLVVGAR